MLRQSKQRCCSHQSPIENSLVGPRAQSRLCGKGCRWGRHRERRRTQRATISRKELLSQQAIEHGRCHSQTISPKLCLNFWQRGHAIEVGFELRGDWLIFPRKTGCVRRNSYSFILRESIPLALDLAEHSFTKPICLVHTSHVQLGFSKSLNGATRQKRLQV